MESKVGNLIEIINNNLRFYETIKPKTLDDNYTVFASLNDYRSSRLLALAAGTQANLTGDIQDCHAESLLKRAFKRYLIDSIIAHTKNQDSSKSSLAEFIAKQCQIDLILFVSKFPCGFIKRYQGSEPINAITGETIMRKPGRGIVKDGIQVYVEKDNCNTKLTRWLKFGFQGKRIYTELNIYCRIKQILVGNCESPEVDLHQIQEFRARLGCDDSVGIELIDKIRIDEFIVEKDKKPQPVALVWWASHVVSTKNQVTNGSKEYIVSGHKMGLTKKQILSDNEAYKLKVSTAALAKDLRHIGEYLYIDS